MVLERHEKTSNMISKIKEYLRYLVTEYDIDNVYFQVFRQGDKNALTYEFAGQMVTKTTVTTESDTIVDMCFHVYTSYESLYGVIIDHNMDYDESLKDLMFVTRHEVGHMLLNRKYIGKSLGEWNEHRKVTSDEYNSRMKVRLRKNASYKTRLDWFIDYMDSPVEKAANEAVGITTEMCIENFNTVYKKGKK